jgi:hypothetical protein
MSASSQREPSALDDVLGVDTDAFTRDHMAEYDRLTKKWSECEMDEWVAGAEGLRFRSLPSGRFLNNCVEMVSRVTAILDTVSSICCLRHPRSISVASRLKTISCMPLPFASTVLPLTRAIRSKVKLYGTLHQKLDARSHDLEGRQNALAVAKDMYVKDSQSAIIQD